MATEVMIGPRSDERAWNITLWISQACLAWLLGMAGVLRAFLPLSSLQERLPWADPAASGWVRFTGVVLICAAAALVLPPLLRLGQKLVPATALAMALAMVVSVASHLIRNRPGLLIIDLTIGALCVIVAWGRTQKVPY